MRLTSYINNQKCLEWGLNLQQGALFDLLNQVAGWAEPIYIDGAVYYWVAKSKICEEIPLAYAKPDTAYRALKTLEEKGLILYTKFGSKDCISLTEKGKSWNSEINPSLGNKSEQTRKKIRKSSEINPTYNTTNDNSTIDNNITPISPENELANRGVDSQTIHDFLKVRKAKRAPLTISAIEIIEKEAVKAGISFAAAIKICAQKSWQGFEAKWIQGNGNSSHDLGGNQYENNSDVVADFLQGDV